MKTPIRELASTIKRLRGGTATHVETVPVKEEFKGKVICRGDVEGFDLRGNKLATRAYAWMHGLDDTQRNGTLQCCTCLQFDSPQAAVGR